VSGTIDFQGKILSGLPERELQKIRGKQLAYIPQSPMNALNPIMTIGRQLIETYVNSSRNSPSGYERAFFLLKRVGFLQPELVMQSLPCHLSGGMRQRVLIAMALMNAPRLLIADEPTTALDVTLQAEILDLLQDLQKECGLGILLITHDLGIVARSAQRVAILYSGRTIEHGSVDDIFYRPKTSYTKTLLDSLISHPTLQATV
jgi:ABC-type dipeptide/oligopeptide/nickel transport system ATPase component